VSAAPPRSETARQALLDALARGPFTAHELSREVGIPERDVVSHLEHLEKSARARGARLVMEPPVCEECGFSFKKRDRLGRPSRCPVCRSGRVSPPRFRIG